MFGWGEGIEQKVAPAPLNLLRGNASDRSGIDSLGLGGQGAENSPSGISTMTALPAESGVALSSPQTTGFGWSSFNNTQPTMESSHPGSNLAHSRTPSHSLVAVGEDKPPSTSSRASSYETRDPSGILSQPVTPGRSTKSDSPISGNHSRQPSHTPSLAPTQPSSPRSIRGSTEVVETTLITETQTDNTLPSTRVVSKSVNQAPEKTSASASGTGFDEWHAFENMTTTVKLSSAKDANCDFDEWGAFGDLAKVEDPQIAGSKATSSVGAQVQISGLPIKISGKEEGVIRSKEDEWSAFEEAGAASKTASLDKSSTRSSLQIPMKLEDEGKSDNGSCLAAFEDPLTFNSPSEQPLARAQAKLAESSRLSAQKTDDWGSFDAFEGALKSSPAVSALLSIDIPQGSIAKPVVTPGLEVQPTDNWGSFEAFESALTPQPLISNQPPRIPSIQPPKQLNVKPTDKPSSNNQNNEAWGSFDTFEKPRSKTAGNFSLPALSISSNTATKPPVPQVSSTPVVTEDDDDDWGEMVQSPQVPDAGSRFDSTLRPTSSTPRTLSPVPPQFTQPSPLQPAPTTPMFDFSSFETKTHVPERSSKPANDEGTDTWDLSFFDSPVATNKAPVNVAASGQRGNDLWDAPAPAVVGRRMNAREADEDRIVRGIVDGLPDLGYMLRQA